jgi:hypothetical protein
VAVTTTSLIFDAEASSSNKNMLGEQIAELKGKIMGQRVFDSEAPRMETSVSLTGSIKGVPVKQSATYVNRPTSTGILYGKGQVVIMAEDSEVATFTGEGFARVGPSGGVKRRGAFFFQNSSTGKLAFLNNIVAVFETDVDKDGNVTEKGWEWK